MGDGWGPPGPAQLNVQGPTAQRDPEAEGAWCPESEACSHGLTVTSVTFRVSLTLSFHTGTRISLLLKR